MPSKSIGFVATWRCNENLEAVVQTEIASPIEVVSAFLDERITGAKSSIRVEFSPVAGLQTLDDAIFYIIKLGPIPFLLCLQGDVDMKEVAVESIGGPTKLIFNRDPSTGDPDGDLAEILQWFAKRDVAVELLPIDVIEWFPQQFTGATNWLGIAIEPGWMPIVVDACRQIQSALTPAELKNFHWIQIREDWGKLMMYWEPRHCVAVCIVSPVGGIGFVKTTDGSNTFHDQDDLASVAAAKK